jgi:hypothetical protein
MFPKLGRKVVVKECLFFVFLRTLFITSAPLSASWVTMDLRVEDHVFMNRCTIWHPAGVKTSGCFLRDALLRLLMFLCLATGAMICDVNLFLQLASKSDTLQV